MMICGHLSNGIIKLPTKPTSIWWAPGYNLLLLLLVVVKLNSLSYFLYVLKTDVCLPENQTCPSRFSRAWGRMGRTKAFLSWSMWGPQDPAHGRSWMATFELFLMQYTWTNESHLVVTWQSKRVAAAEMAPWMARRKPHQGSSKPWKSSFSTVCQVHWYPDWPYQWFRIIKLICGLRWMTQ